MTYDPTTWNEGAAPGISAGELNRIEQGIVDAHKGPIIPELDASAHSNQYPDGKSYMAIFTASGWPENVGSVHTFVGSRGSGQRIWQMFFGKTTDIVYFRSRNQDDTAWEPWNELVSANVGNQVVIEAATVTSSDLLLTTGYQTYLSDTITIPSNWGSYRLTAWADITVSPGATTAIRSFSTVLRLDGNDSPDSGFIDLPLILDSASGGPLYASVQHSRIWTRTGTATGARSVSIRVRANNTPAPEVVRGTLITRATRTG